MTRRTKGVLLIAVQLLLVVSLGVKLLADRATRPRVWMRAEPYDPNLPIRGRYVRLRLVDAKAGFTGYDPSEPLAFFIPEHIPDPSRRAANEELWVEVTLPAKGAPRPIRLGVKKDGVLTPLDIR